jgi:hypothetical protein
MAQHDMNIANQGFPATRADLNNALQALASNNSGTSAPSTTFANQWWYDTTNNKLYIRNEANNAWIQVAVLDQTNAEWQITTGVVQAKDSDGLALKTDDGTTRLFVKDSDGFIGIGTASPDTQLTVESDATTQLKLINDNADNNGARLTFFKNSASPADSDTLGIIDFNANNSAGSGKVFARISSLADDVTSGTEDSHIAFSTRSAGTLEEVLSIQRYGIKMGQGNGIDFHDYGTGTNISSNFLDDYETGSFTPAASPALSTSSGVYRKIGKLVHVGMKFTNAASSSASAVTITGLPFTNQNDNAARAGLVVSWNSSGVGAGLQFLIGLNTTTGVFYLDGSARSLANMSEKTVYIGGTYPVA